MTATPQDPRDRDDIDAEFAALMEGVDFDDSILEEAKDEPPTGYNVPNTLRQPDAPNAPGSAGSLTGPTPAHPGSVEVPDDLSGLNDTAPAEDPNAPTPIAIVATPLASAKSLAGVIRLAMAAEDDVTALPHGTVTADSESGAIAVGNLSEAEAHTVAHLVSLGLQRQGVVMFWRRGDRMIAVRYRNGRNEGETPPALVLGALSGTVEDLLLGVEKLDEIPETFDPASLSRTDATDWIRGNRRR